MKRHQHHQYVVDKVKLLKTHDQVWITVGAAKGSSKRLPFREPEELDGSGFGIFKYKGKLHFGFFNLDHKIPYVETHNFSTGSHLHGTRIRVYGDKSLKAVCLWDYDQTSDLLKKGLHPCEK